MSALEKEVDTYWSRLPKVMTIPQLQRRLKIDYDIIDALAAERKEAIKRIGEIDQVRPTIWDDITDVVTKLRQRGQGGIIYRVSKEAKEPPYGT